MFESISFILAQKTTELVTAGIQKAVTKKINKTRDKILVKENNRYIQDLVDAGYEIE